MEIAVILLLFAGFIALDTTGGPQVLISEPLVSCSIVGYILGSTDTGLMIGMMFQLLWFGYLPLGAVRIPDSNLAAFITAVSLITVRSLFQMDAVEQIAAVVPALLVGIAAGFAGSKLIAYARRRNAVMSDRLLDRLERNKDIAIERSHFLGMMRSVLRGMLIFLVLTPVSMAGCAAIILLPEGLKASLASSVPILWGTACASAAIVSIMKGNSRQLAIGAIGGIVWLMLL